MYAIKDSNTEEELEISLKRNVPHIFGDHTLYTSAEWCTFKKNPSEFRYKSLPNGNPLTDENLRSKVDELSEKCTRRSENLIDLESTQANESFNQMVSTKAPKAKYYGGSDSFMTRVSASVLPKNEGHSYLTKVNEAALLSPGQFTINFSSKFDKARSFRKEKEKCIDFKRKKIAMKRKKRITEQRATLKEGATYCTDVDLKIKIFTPFHQHCP